MQEAVVPKDSLDVPPWVEDTLAATQAEDALVRAQRREKARRANRGLWSALGPEADPELASTPGHDPRPIQAPEAEARDADAVWLPLGDAAVPGQGPGKV